MKKISNYLTRKAHKVEDLHATSGDVFHIYDKRGDFYITVIDKDTSDSGFYYFIGQGHPNPNPTVSHSNSLFSFNSFSKIKHINFEKQTYKGFKWVKTNYPVIDEKMANLGSQYQMFQKFAPENYKKIYEEQEDKNQHTKNAKMVKSFCDWVVSGKKPQDFIEA